VIHVNGFGHVAALRITSFPDSIPTRCAAVCAQLYVRNCIRAASLMLNVMLSEAIYSYSSLALKEATKREHSLE
jgi:hypothetical protein